jgi:hypothetical protein
MDNGIVGTEALQSTSGEVFLNTYQGLLRQKDKIDKDLLRFRGKFFKAISRTGALVQKRAIYVPRLDNKKILSEAIRKCMVPGREMTMNDILKSLKKKDLYHTDSKYFYTMVNNKLNRDDLIEKTSRGVFVYRPSCVKRKGIEASRRKKVVSKVVA